MWGNLERPGNRQAFIGFLNMGSGLCASQMHIVKVQHHQGVSILMRFAKYRYAVTDRLMLMYRCTPLFTLFTQGVIVERHPV